MKYSISQSNLGRYSLIKSIIILTFIVSILFNSGYAYSTFNEDIGKYLIAIMTFPLFIICLRRLLVDNLNLYSSTYIFFMFTFLCSIVFNFSFLTLNSFIMPILMVTFSLCITYFIDFKTFAHYFIKCMKIITSISLVIYILIDFLGVKLNLPTITNVNGVEYDNGIVFFIINSNSEMGFRNTGVFWEPGLFASFLILAMVFEIYFKPAKISIINMMIFVLGLLSTKSTAGYVLLLFVIALVISKMSKKGNPIGSIIIILLSAFLYFWYDKIIKLLLTYNYDLFIKLVEMSGSGSTRLFGPLLNLEIFKSYPVFGAGFSNANTIYMQNMHAFEASSQTSTSTYFLASLGIFGALYTCLWVYGILQQRKIPLVGRVAIIFIVLIILNKEPHVTTLFMYCFLFFLLKNASLNKINSVKMLRDDARK